MQQAKEKAQREEHEEREGAEEEEDVVRPVQSPPPPRLLRGVLPEGFSGLHQEKEKGSEKEKEIAKDSVRNQTMESRGRDGPGEGFFSSKNSSFPHYDTLKKRVIPRKRFFFNCATFWGVVFADYAMREKERKNETVVKISDCYIVLCWCKDESSMFV